MAAVYGRVQCEFLRGKHNHENAGRHERPSDHEYARTRFPQHVAKLGCPPERIDGPTRLLCSMLNTRLSHRCWAVTIAGLLMAPFVAGQSFTQHYGGMLSQDGVGIAVRGGQYFTATTVFDSTAQRHRGRVLITDSGGEQVSWNELLVDGAVFLQAAEEASDGSIFVAGSVIPPGAVTHDGLLVKMDASGAVQWIAQPERMGDEQYFDLAALPDGGVIACGLEATGSGHNAWISRFNADGGTLWNTSTGGPLDEEAYAVAVNANGAMMTGRQMNFGGTSDAWFGFVDLAGVVQMTTSFGGVGTESGRAIANLGTDDFVMAGVTDSYGIYDATEQRIKDNVYLVALHANGDSIWTRAVGDTLFDRGAWSMGVADNGDLLVGGERFTQALSNALVYRLDGAGAFVWERAYDTGKEEKLLDLLVIPGGFVATGWSSTELSRQVLLLRRNDAGD